MIKDLNLKPEMLKVLKENIGTIPQGRGVGKNYLNRTGMAQKPASSINTQDNVKTSSCVAKATPAEQSHSPPCGESLGQLDLG